MNNPIFARAGNHATIDRRPQHLLEQGRTLNVIKRYARRGGG